MGFIIVISLQVELYNMSVSALFDQGSGGDFNGFNEFRENSRDLLRPSVSVLCHRLVPTHGRSRVFSENLAAANPGVVKQLMVSLPPASVGGCSFRCISPVIPLSSRCVPNSPPFHLPSATSTPVSQTRVWLIIRRTSCRGTLRLRYRSARRVRNSSFLSLPFAALSLIAFFRCTFAVFRTLFR